MQSTEIMSAMVVAMFNVRNVKVIWHLANAFMNVYNVTLVEYTLNKSTHQVNQASNKWRAQTSIGRNPLPANMLWNRTCIT